jgi:hypothetical protein
LFETVNDTSLRLLSSRLTVLVVVVMANGLGMFSSYVSDLWVIVSDHRQY